MFAETTKTVAENIVAFLLCFILSHLLPLFNHKTLERKSHILFCANFWFTWCLIISILVNNSNHNWIVDVDARLIKLSHWLSVDQCTGVHSPDRDSVDSLPSRVSQYILRGRMDIGDLLRIQTGETLMYGKGGGGWWGDLICKICYFMRLDFAYL